MPGTVDESDDIRPRGARVPTAEFLAENIGSWIHGDPVVVDRQRVIAFSEAINAPLTRHGGDATVTPMFSVLPIYSCLFDAVDLVTPEDLRSTILHGAHEIRFDAPVRIGGSLQARARPTGVHAVSIGTAVTVEIEVIDQDGQSVSAQVATAIVRGAATARDEGAGPPEVGLGGQNADGSDVLFSPQRMVSALRPDQTGEFARVSGDTHAVHLDDDVARALGFEGVILHGLCTLGIACEALVGIGCDGDPGRLRRLAVRFAAPAYPRGALTTEVSPLGDGRHTFVTTGSSGVPVLTHGLAETSPA